MRSRSLEFDTMVGVPQGLTGTQSQIPLRGMIRRRPTVESRLRHGKTLRNRQVGNQCEGACICSRTEHRLDDPRRAEQDYAALVGRQGINRRGHEFEGFLSQDTFFRHLAPVQRAGAPMAAPATIRQKAGRVDHRFIILISAEYIGEGQRSLLALGADACTVDQAGKEPGLQGRAAFKTGAFEGKRKGRMAVAN